MIGSGHGPQDEPGVNVTPVFWRDYNGERGPVPTDYRAHDWQTCRVLRVLSQGWRTMEEAQLLQMCRRTAGSGFPVKATAARRFHERMVRRGAR